MHKVTVYPTVFVLQKASHPLRRMQTSSTITINELLYWASTGSTETADRFAVKEMLEYFEGLGKLSLKPSLKFTLEMLSLGTRAYGREGQRGCLSVFVQL